MSRHLATLLFGFALLFPVAASAVTEEDFQVKDTQSLLNLCTAPQSDPLHGEAIHFCHGYLVGAIHYDRMTNTPLFCPPDPPPSRNDGVERFVTWAKAHPQFMQEVPVETEFRFLTETWPCK